MIYHEVTVISILFWDLIKTSVDSREYDLHHELYELYGAVLNEDVCKVKKYTGARGNLSAVIRLVKLHNFITFATVVDAAEMRPLGFKVQYLLNILSLELQYTLMELKDSQIR